jgi:hypothetical protein
MGQVGSGNRKDVRNAVEAAHGAGGGWGKRSAHDRSQILCVHVLPWWFLLLLLLSRCPLRPQTTQQCSAEKSRGTKRLAVCCRAMAEAAEKAPSMTRKKDDDRGTERAVQPGFAAGTTSRRT